MIAEKAFASNRERLRAKRLAREAIASPPLSSRSEESAMVAQQAKNSGFDHSASGVRRLDYIAETGTLGLKAKWK